MPRQKRDKKADTHFFAIYEVSLSEAVSRNLFLKETDGTKPIDHAQEHFENTLQGNALPLVKVKQLPKRKGEAVAQEDFTALHNDILAAREHVFLLRINNEKHKTVIQEDGLEADGKTHYGEKKFIAEAYCYDIRIPLDESHRDDYIISSDRGKFRIASENALKYDIVKKIIEKARGKNISNSFCLFLFCFFIFYWV